MAVGNLRSRVVESSGKFFACGVYPETAINPPGIIFVDGEPPDNIDRRFAHWQSGAWIEVVPEHSIAQAKKQKFAELWKAFKRFQKHYMDAEDLILANTLAEHGSAKGLACRAWIQGLWAQYYALKDDIASLTDIHAIEQYNCIVDYAECPHTVRALNEEAAAAFAE